MRAGKKFLVKKELFCLEPTGVVTVGQSRGYKSVVLGGHG